MNYHGIKSIYCVPTQDLPAYIREVHQAGASPMILCPLFELSVGPGASAEQNTENVPEGTLTVSTLSFISDVLPFDESPRQMAFIFTDADNGMHILGTKEPPYPNIKIKKINAAPGSGRSASEVTIEWHGPLISVVCPLLSSF